jgi:prepilin-type N-terminal cleavage/methylation domain-containing protein
MSKRRKRLNNPLPLPILQKVGFRRRGFMKRAFTLVELVLVVVIVGIISAVMVPRLNRSTLDEAAHQIVSHIRYTQHLALMDDKFDPDKNFWFKERWQILFSRNLDGEQVWTYTIFSDQKTHDKNPNISNEIARDPLNPGVLNAQGRLDPSKPGQYLSGGYNGVLDINDTRRNKKMLLRDAYNINWISFSKSCSTGNPGTLNQSRKIIFDRIGRPYYYYQRDSLSSSADNNPYTDMRLITEQCIITLYEKSDQTGKNVKIAIEPETGYTHIL